MKDNIPLYTKPLILAEYAETHEKMRAFTHIRDEKTVDELWLVEHSPVFTQGQAGKVEHILNPGDIPVVQSDRGGQVTYHGPGQLVVYPLLDLRRLNLGVRDYVSALENTVVRFLNYYGVEAAPKAGAPGVYVNGDKIASLGIRVRKGCCFHGVAINIDMDLSPFQRINPCGYPELKMVQLSDFVNELKLPNMETAGQQFTTTLADELNMLLVNEMVNE